MPRYAAFLRGINVSGRRATKEQLCACFEAVGFTGVSTFRASGNIVFESADENLATLAAAIEEGLVRALGYGVTTFLRSAEDVQRMAAFEPFARAAVDASGGRLQVILLAVEPAPRVQTEVLAMATDKDRLRFGERELYWLPAGNMRESGLDLRRMEALLGSMTMRTKGTIEQLAGRYFAR